MKNIFLFLAFVLPLFVYGNPDSLPPANQFWKGGIKVPLSKDTFHYFQVTFLNQTWIRWNESNTGTLFNNEPKDQTVDIGLRRTRIQLYGQLTDWAFLYFQFGLNNFNRAFNSNNGNRKLSSFFHDAVCEIHPFRRKNYLKIGGGLTIGTGLSRFSQPSIGSIMTMDVPVFAQYAVDQIDEFARKLSVYVRGQVWKIDYRLVASDPFPITSSGASAYNISKYAQFAPNKHNWQYQGYLAFQFFEHEAHTTPYMTGTYMGKKKILNIAGGIVYQPNAVWLNPTGTDTAYQKMLHYCVESYLDMPVGAKEKGMAVSAYIGYFNTNYGSNYLRYNGLMNPANGTNNPNAVLGASNTFGNAYPMFGTGHTLYAQAGFLMPQTWFGKTGFQLMPYASLTQSWYQRLAPYSVLTFQGGINWYLSGTKAKISLDYQNRPTFGEASDGSIFKDKRRSQVILQLQMSL